MPFHAGQFFDILNRMENHMGAVAQALANIPAAIETAKNAIVAKLDELEQQVAAGGVLDADDQTAIAAVQNGVADLQSVVPAPAPAPAAPSA
jgi:hypothetical protein